MKLALWSLLGALLCAAPSTEPERVDFADLSGFEYEEGMELPAEVTRYHEQEIQVSIQVIIKKSRMCCKAGFGQIKFFCFFCEGQITVIDI